MCQAISSLLGTTLWMQIEKYATKWEMLLQSLEYMMTAIRKVSAALIGRQIAALKAAVETGEYATTSEIVREAQRDCQVTELRQEDINHLRQMRNDGKASGGTKAFDIARTIAGAENTAQKGWR
jgi:antitoxin ParD1/3/4